MKHLLIFFDGYPACWPLDKLGDFDGGYNDVEVDCEDCLALIKKDNEDWLPIEQFPLYEITKLGRIRNARTNYVVHRYFSNWNSLRASIYSDGKLRTKAIRGLVISTFGSEVI